MKTLNNPKSKGLILPASLIALIAVIAVSASWVVQKTNNYAAEVASPLEKNLAAAGGVKKCSRGDDGRGGAVSRPWYEAYYELPVGKADAESTIKRISKEAGYKLVHASPSNKGHLTYVGDPYIQDWYFDETSQQSVYKQLMDGPVKLALGANASGAKEACGKAIFINVDDKHSVVNISVRLPEYKR